MRGQFYIFPELIFLLLTTIGTQVFAKQDNSGGARLKNPCPTACRIEGKTECRSVFRNDPALNVTVACETYLKHKFSIGEECTERCKHCLPIVLTSRCSKSLKKLSNHYALCKLKPDTGPCRASILMWYYDYEKEECRTFVYGGCKGNDNRFETQYACMLRCGYLAMLEPKPNIWKLPVGFKHEEF